jgi:hypothetical protein
MGDVRESIKNMETMPSIVPFPAVNLRRGALGELLGWTCKCQAMLVDLHVVLFIPRAWRSQMHRAPDCWLALALFALGHAHAHGTGEGLAENNAIIRPAALRAWLAG